MKRLYWLLFLSLPLTSFGQGNDYIYNFQIEYFFGNAFSPRTEALGGSDVAIGGEVSSIFYNPASLGELDDQELQFTNSRNFYALPNSKYFFWGYGHRILPKLTLSLSINHFAVGPSSFSVDIDGIDFPVTKGTTTNYALSGSYEVIKNLFVGVNANLYQWNIFRDNPSNFAVHFDGGVLYKLQLSETEKLNQFIKIGVSLNNFAFSKITFNGPSPSDTVSATNTFPVVFRVGANYNLGTTIQLPGLKAGSLRTMIGMEYQTLFNSEFHTAFRLSSETILYDFFVFRMGWYTMNINDFANPVNNDRLRNFTYGFGVIIPTTDFSKLPFNIQLDYTSLQQPPFSTFTGRLPNIRSFALTLAVPVADNP